MYSILYSHKFPTTEILIGSSIVKLQGDMSLPLEKCFLKSVTFSYVLQKLHIFSKNARQSSSQRFLQFDQCRKPAMLGRSGALSS